MASLSGAEDNATGRGDDPSPTTAMGPRERIELAPLIEHRAPASIRAATVASIHFFMYFTSTILQFQFELQSCRGSVARCVPRYLARARLNCRWARALISYGVAADLTPDRARDEPLVLCQSSSGAVDKVVANILNTNRPEKSAFRNLFGRLVSCSRVHEPSWHYSQTIHSL